MLRQIEWGVQNGPITKNRVLPVTTFFLKILFQFKNLIQRVDLMYQLPKCPYSMHVTFIHVFGKIFQIIKVFL